MHPLRLAGNWFSEAFFLPPASASFCLQTIPYAPEIRPKCAPRRDFWLDRFQIVSSSATLLCAFRAFATSHLFSVAYGLFGALAALFQRPILCFQALADSFVKTGGVGYSHSGSSRPQSTSGPGFDTSGRTCRS